ncbi:hypothetical protein NDU88_004077 [Pleurodeles waltl]|uniref:Uncharacterized protein n=1 Tax=Pleurodeles waltl TaxID=8319 RepID=A0AAV7VHQ1_PLEWA|nr:hypothetical protein NDU88_004077 [Pleurodeles waltl]
MAIDLGLRLPSDLGACYENAYLCIILDDVGDGSAPLTFVVFGVRQQPKVVLRVLGHASKGFEGAILKADGSPAHDQQVEVPVERKVPGPVTESEVIPVPLQVLGTIGLILEDVFFRQSGIAVSEHCMPLGQCSQCTLLDTVAQVLPQVPEEALVVLSQRVAVGRDA